MGGQVGDCGVLVSENETIEIIDSKRENNQTVHIVKQLPKDPTAQFMACVDTNKRDASAANHTATHLLDYALKQVLGDHVEQKGSFVSPDTLRFDFSHFEKVSDDMASDHQLNAGQMVREAAKLIQGGGGGQPHFAQAGGKNADGLSAAVDKVIELAKL